jgi:cholesterol oxidase
MAPEHVRNVVVGSGFGGSVTAYRLADAGEEVVVLERGKAYPPGSFPRPPAAVARGFWDPSEGHHGMFDVWSFRGIEAVVASGLGGGSLIYANVLLRKDEKWFVKDAPVGDGHESWPIGRADLDPHYDAVEKMLGASRFPLGKPGYEASNKTRAMRDAAERLGLEWQLPPLAVSFGVEGEEPRPGVALPTPAYGNLHGLTRVSCRLCGECDLGCNSGSKNTLDHTYLSAAQHAGADLRTRCEVRSFAPRPSGGWTLTYVEHDPASEGRVTDTSRLPRKTLTCDRLVLAAGTLGTTFLLLRNRSVLPAISRTLGRRFSGNGDLLGFVRGATQDGVPLQLGSTSAPVITSAIRVPDAVDGGWGRGYYVEDAGYPGFVDWLLETGSLRRQARRAARFAFDRARARVTRSARSSISRDVARLLGDGGCSGGATPLLAMGRDVPDGVMRLREGYLDIDWTTATSREFFDDITATMRQLADSMGGSLIQNPLSHLRRVVTVHPLGGAPMSTGPRTGVVDEWGEVFGHPGLFVADGAAMPGPVGANPSLTIAAFADRLAEHLLETPQPTASSVPAPRRTREPVS